MKTLALVLLFGFASFLNSLFDWEAPTAKVKQSAVQPVTSRA